MDEKTIDAPVELFVPEPANERKLDDEEDRKLAQNMALHGQLQPVIAFELAAADKGVRKLQLVDGHRRWHGCILNGSPKTLKTQVLPHAPTEGERAKIRNITERHKQKLRPSERLRNICNAVTLNGWSPSEAARQLGEEQPFVSKNLLFNERATEPLKKLFEAEKIGLDDGYLASQLPPEQQNALAALTEFPKRDQLKGMLKRKGEPAPKETVRQDEDERDKMMSASVPLPGKFTVMVRGPAFDMPTFVQVLTEARTQANRAMAKGHDPKSLRNYFKKFPPEQKD